MATSPPSAAPKTDGPPRRRDAARNRERLLAAAAEVFAESGASASLKDVADRAGLGVGTVYRHMPNKDAVIAALLRPQLDRLRTFAEAALTTEPTFATFADLIQRITEAMAGSKALSEIILYRHELPEELRDPVDQVLGRCAQVMERAQHTGELHPDLDITDLVVCFTCTHAVETTFADHGQGASRRLLALILDGMRVRREGPITLPEPTFALPDLIDGLGGTPGGHSATP